MSENPYQSSDHPAGAAPRRPILTAGGIVLGVIALGLVVMVLLPAQRGAREAPRRHGCLNNTKHIVLAMLNYESAHGSFPPAYTVDAQGNRLHSWRTLILPFMEEQELYDKIDLARPWDDPANAEAREALVQSYCCPSAPYEDEHLTTYVAVVGPDTMFPGSTPRTRDQVMHTVSTICIVEVDADRAIHWMSPHDITLEDVLAEWPAKKSYHPGGAMAGYLDGSARLLPQDIDRGELRNDLMVQKTFVAPAASGATPAPPVEGSN